MVVETERLSGVDHELVARGFVGDVHPYLAGGTDHRDGLLVETLDTGGVVGVAMAQQPVALMRARFWRIPSYASTLPPPVNPHTGEDSFPGDVVSDLLDLDYLMEQGDRATDLLRVGYACIRQAVPL
jgi:hypothetical protein